jgi:UPF0271 protein
MAKYIDINCDMGESYGRWTLGHDEEVMPNITSANIACGFHAGDPHVMRRTVELAVRHGVAIGSHPGMPDLMGFGRRAIDVTPQEMKDYHRYQTGALWAFCKAAGVELQHVKPHGALFSMAVRDGALADAIARAAAVIDRALILFGLPGSELVAAGKRAGLRTASEGFADRAYQPDGTLVPRHREDSVIRDADVVVPRVIRMVRDQVVDAIDGSVVPKISVIMVCATLSTPMPAVTLKHSTIQSW